jgi:hypothetical protein
VFSQLMSSREQMQIQAQHVVVVEDCNMGYHDPNQNLKGSLAWHMIQIASARPQCEDNRPGVTVPGTDRMWMRPM